MLLLWFLWIPNIESFWTFPFVHLRHKPLVYIPYADTFYLTFAVKKIIWIEICQFKLPKLL